MSRECWSKRRLPHCGDRVFDVADERHIARVDKVTWGHSVDLTFDNGLRAVDVTLFKPNGEPRIIKAPKGE